MEDRCLSAERRENGARTGLLLVILLYPYQKLLIFRIAGIRAVSFLKDIHLSRASRIYIVCSVSTVFRIKFLREMTNAYNHKNHKIIQKRFTNNTCILEYLF